MVAAVALALSSVAAAAVPVSAAVPASAARAAQSPSAQSPAGFEEPHAVVHRLLQLANERLALMSAVAAWKWQHHAPVSAPAREQAVIGQAGELAARLGLSRAAVERIFALQVALARDEETRLQQRWQTQGYDYPGQPPDLQAVVRPALARIQAAGVLRIGTTGDYAPFSLDAAGHLTGVDIDLGRALAAKLGVRAVFVRTSWRDLLADLAAGRFDVAMSGISISPARAAAAAFSLPYYTGGKTILARCADAAQFSSLAALDRPKVTLIVNPGGTNQQFVQAHVHHARVRVFADNRGAFAEILARRADAMITDDIEVELQVQAHPGLCRAMPGTLTRESKAILMSRDPGLTAAVNQWLRTELADGRPAALIQARIRSVRGA